MLPADPVQGFQGFVGKIGHMTNGQVTMIRRGGKKHLSYVSVVSSLVQSSGQTALSPFTISDFYKLAKPGFKGL